MWGVILNLIQFIIKRIQYKSRVEDKIDKVLTRQDDLERRLLRLEIISAIERNDRSTVHNLYDIYKKEYDGNSYMTEMYKDYCKKPNKRSKK